MSDQIVSFQSTNIARSRDESKYPWMWDGLVGSWAMIEGGGTTAFDWSAYQNSATLLNGTTWANGLTGSGLNFNGSNNYASVAHNSVYKPSKELSVSLWARPDSVGDAYDKMLIDCGFQKATQGFGVFRITASTKLQPTIQHTGGTLSFNTNGTVPNGAWTHICMRYVSGGYLECYLDGVFDSSSASTGGDIVGGSEPLTFAYRDLSAFGILRYYDGLLDDIRVYRRALGASEIRELYRTRPKSFLARHRRRSRFATVISGAAPWIYRRQLARLGA